MEECFLSSKATLIKPNGGVFTSREIDIISCILNGGTAKAISTILGISHHTVSTHIGKIRNDLNLSSQDKIIRFVESSDNYIQIRERYMDLLLFSKFIEKLSEINALKISPKYGCVVHAKIEEIDKYILLDYLKLAKIKVDISHGSAEYAEDKFHIICYPIGMNLENLNSDNIVASENHNNNIIDLIGQCIESNGSGTQYKSYFSLLGCISKIYSSKTVDDILNEFKEYYFKIKDKKFRIDPEQNHMEVTDKRKTKYVIFVMLFFIALLSLPITIHWYKETLKTHLTNINMLVGEDIFLKRKDLASKMNEILEKQNGIKFLVLVGQGGIGKTTIARHYINKNNAKIKWEINAVTEESTMKSLLELAIELSKTNSEKREEQKYIQAIEDPEIKKKSIISFVFSQLKERKDWMLLFDNVDDFKMIYGFILSNRGLCNEGTIIITTRNANCDNASFVSSKSVLNIRYLEKDERKKLFCDILYDEQSELSEDKIKEIDKFLENIPPMPLDVSNAAYYIKNTSGSFEKYLEILRSPNEKTEKLHSKFLNEGTEYNKTRYKMTVAVFDKLVEINPDFKELLLFICLLDSKNIPRRYIEQCKDFAIVSDFIQNLKRFFSISLESGKFSIHKSIQEIGLIHLVDLLTNDEKEVFFKKIINIMTPYSAILWQKYKTYPYKMKATDIDELEIHIKHMINSLKLLSISEKNKYIAKLLLAVGFIYGEDNFSQVKYFLKEALKYNGNNGYIENYEYAVALLLLGYAHLDLDEFDDANLLLNKGLEFCSTLKDAEILKAYGFCDLGRYYARINEFSKAIALFEKALSIADDNQESWVRKISAEICAGLSHAYADHYINKPEGEKAIVYAQKSFEKLGFKNYLYSKSEDIKKLEDDFRISYFRALAKAYNRIGDYDSAQECSNSFYNLYEKYFKNDEDILYSKALIDIEYGYTLLRKGELDSALDKINRAINAKKELNANYSLFFALVSQTETLVRLNKLDEAYSSFQYAISQKGNAADNYSKLLFCISLYHAFIIKYRQKDYKLAFEHFSDFCSSIKEFCKGFLSTSAYNELLRANVFEIITDKSQIKAGLQNSIEIFSSIYGKDHHFVKDYIVKNAN